MLDRYSTDERKYLKRIDIAFFLLLGLNQCTRARNDSEGTKSQERKDHYVSQFSASSEDAGSPSSSKPAEQDAGRIGKEDDPLALPQEQEDGDLKTRGKHLFEAILYDDCYRATDFLFPRDAFIATHQPADPKLWRKQVQVPFCKDIYFLHNRLKKKKNLTFMSLQLGYRIQLMKTLKEGWSQPAWEVQQAKLLFIHRGSVQKIDVGQMVGWKGNWYITKLRNRNKE
ncbi:hypothetical protein BCY86_01480 [Pajaroellobacter abortibovis]|uniref:Uncharacterized protein n=1 Tax=Pajaroellobacter abortibovis TaxID=1882918 RepID=A0A1L6MVE4_9BACT|nr:hypothetical protein BCY86_01480 [Pajaroellobacter abortibovis]